MLGHPLIAADWRGRVMEAAERRIAIFERIMPLKRQLTSTVTGPIFCNMSP